ncbi:hypothetical protein [Pannonibacter phragmitetus]|uniref:hypothetical protein n=1 Tax=Pannonibacter phragmitetus TaxID=121719 RepID=UPI000B97049E|nr:hypothetical protein [Pannonibacter phragmitetus]
MIHREIKSIDGGSAQYWQDRRVGFRLIREAEEAVESLKHEPMYIAGNWDDDYGDYEPVENLAPFDRVDEVIAEIEANETAVSILIAQRRTHIGDWKIRAVIYALARLDGDDPEGDYELLHGPD